MDVDSADFQIPDHSIVQLKELKICQKQFLIEEEKKQREEQEAFRKDLKSILPDLHLAPGTSNCKNFKEVEYNRDFNNILMLSSWMMEEPTDLDNYLLIPTPKGKRISCTRGENSKVTEIFHKEGHKFTDVTINIPKDTQLDGIYSKQTKTIYILDVLRYDGQSMLDADAAFRRYWIRSKFYELRLSIMDQRSEYKLAFLESFDFMDRNLIHSVFQRFPFFTDKAELDGYLFYRKNADYLPGESKNCLWLYPYMIDEVLTMFRVNADYNLYKPQGYTNYLEYIEKFNAKMEKKRQFKPRTNKKDEKDSMKVDYKQCNFYSFDNFRNAEEERKKINELERFGGQGGYFNDNRNNNGRRNNGFQSQRGGGGGNRFNNDNFGPPHRGFNNNFGPPHRGRFNNDNFGPPQRERFNNDNFGPPQRGRFNGPRNFQGNPQQNFIDEFQRLFEDSLQSMLQNGPPQRNFRGGNRRGQNRRY